MREAIVARNQAGESLARIAADVWQELGYANKHVCASKLSVYLRKNGIERVPIRPGPPPGTRTVSRFTEERYTELADAVAAGTGIWAFAGTHWKEWGFPSQVACDGLIRKWLKRRPRGDDAGGDRPSDPRDADPAAA